LNRRDALISFFALSAGPLAAEAQQAKKVWHIGFIWGGSRPSSLKGSRFEELPRRMREFGYVEGDNLVIQWRFAEAKYERLPDLVDELVRLKVDLIVAEGDPAIRAARQATATIPIVSAATGDPVASGFAKSLARPGGNITGVSRNAADTSPKQLELLRAIVPKLSSVAVLVNPNNVIHAVQLTAIQTVAEKAGIKIQPVNAGTAEEIERGFAMMKRERANAVIVPLDGLFISQRQQIAQLAVTHRVASLSLYREHVDAGGLMSYGQSMRDFYRLAATYVDKILRGARPSELPFEQPTNYYLTINRKTAKALGLTISKELLLRADEVIE
jgi:putative ABC transport system substrate-binding protein